MDITRMRRIWRSCSEETTAHCDLHFVQHGTRHYSQHMTEHAFRHKEALCVSTRECYYLTFIAHLNYSVIYDCVNMW